MLNSIPKVNCLIIEDEPSAQYILAHYIKNTEWINLVATASTANAAIKIIHKTKIDLIFLDIDLPGMSGLELLKSINYQPFIIFTTSHSKFAIKSFEYNVVDYLIKPITQEGFNRGTMRIFERINTQSAFVQNSFKTAHHIIIKLNIDNNFEEINTAQIKFTQSFGNYVKIHLECDKNKLANISTKDLLTILPESKFVRIHRSYILNIDKIKKIQWCEIVIDNHSFQVGISYRQLVEKRLTECKND